MGDDLSGTGLNIKKKPFLECPGGPMVKDLALSLLRLLFDSWPRNVHMPWTWPKKHKTNKQTKTPKTQQSLWGHYCGRQPSNVTLRVPASWGSKLRVFPTP